MNIRKSHDPGPVPAAEPGKTQPGLPIQGGPPEDEEIFSDQSPGYDAVASRSARRSSPPAARRPRSGPQRSKVAIDRHAEAGTLSGVVPMRLTPDRERPSFQPHR
jgi:hypothetical protein